ncbi:phenylalanine--tRNA ligase subunit beta [Candidatus Uhrbacteria bacterium]|nr:phenylalanine--tRNA ligase subunit beta [Candidatus Uhrbacteria bacterium]
MDLQVSYQWLREFVDVTLSPEELASQLSLHSVSVERLHRLDANLDRVVVGRIVELAAHPNADKLQVAQVALHAATSSRGRATRTRTVPVVCGGTNLHGGMLVAYAMPGARVRWHGQGELVELAPTEIRGVRSEGMICAASEIGLGTWFPAEGEREILDCTFLESESRSSSDALVGMPIARALGMDDVVFDIEITTNRTDLLGIEGLAREVAVVTGCALRKSAIRPIRVPRSVRAPLAIRLEDRLGCPRYGAVRITGVTHAPAPWWLRRRLLTAGVQPISNIVDVTNYALLAYGHPMHAFDVATLRRDTRAQRSGAAEIVVRRARAGEQLHALDARVYALTGADLVIADAERPIALAGMIGGAETGVSASTQDVVLECAVFDPVRVRATARRLALRTDAVARFEKGIPQASVDAVLDRAASLLLEVAGGVLEARTIVGAPMPKPRPISFRPTDAAAALGVSLRATETRRTLTALGCTVRARGSAWQVTPPWWRAADCTGVHDLVEEVARVYGYHRIPATLPIGQLPIDVLPPAPPQTEFDGEYRVKTVLADIGATEIATYALTSASVIARCGFVPEQCVQLENPLSEEFSLLRPSLIPTLLPVVAANAPVLAKGAVFELANVYIPQTANSASLRKGHARTREQRLPREELRLAIAAYDRSTSGEIVLQVKGMVEHCAAQLGVRGIEFTPATSCNLPSGFCLWHPGRTMDVVVAGVLVGTLGELHPAVLEAAGIPTRVALADLDWAACIATGGAPTVLRAPSAFPAIKRDIAVVVDRRTTYADVVRVIASAHPLLSTCAYFDSYAGEGVPSGMKSLAFHLTFAADRTLTAEEVDAAGEAIAAQLQSQLGATLRT